MTQTTVPVNSYRQTLIRAFLDNFRNERAVRKANIEADAVSEVDEMIHEQFPHLCDCKKKELYRSLMGLIAAVRGLESNSILNAADALEVIEIAALVIPVLSEKVKKTSKG